MHTMGLLTRRQTLTLTCKVMLPRMEFDKLTRSKGVCWPFLRLPGNQTGLVCVKNPDEEMRRDINIFLFGLLGWGCSPCESTLEMMFPDIILQIDTSQASVQKLKLTRPDSSSPSGSACACCPSRGPGWKIILFSCSWLAPAHCISPAASSLWVSGCSWQWVGALALMCWDQWHRRCWCQRCRCHALSSG